MGGLHPSIEHNLRSYLRISLKVCSFLLRSRLLQRGVEEHLFSTSVGEGKVVMEMGWCHVGSLVVGSR